MFRLASDSFTKKSPCSSCSTASWSSWLNINRTIGRIKEAFVILIDYRISWIWADSIQLRPNLNPMNAHLPFPLSVYPAAQDSLSHFNSNSVAFFSSMADALGIRIYSCGRAPLAQAGISSSLKYRIIQCARSGKLSNNRGTWLSGPSSCNLSRGQSRHTLRHNLILSPAYLLSQFRSYPKLSERSYGPERELRERLNPLGFCGWPEVAASP
jgi:hypothetical protein